jgi:cystathionine beta-lyase/cystathionine gamma-synthase
MSGFGGMISIELGTRDRAAHVLKSVRVFSLAESLGGVESLISHPATMTHASVTPEFRQKLGISDGLVRLSCGVEDTEDLIADLEQAFDGLPKTEGRKPKSATGKRAAAGAR